VGDVDWIDLTHDSDKLQMVVNAIMALRAPYIVSKFLTSRGPSTLSFRTLLYGDKYC
jgi:hypothetical protein